jgi:cellulose biosynthesis protein BcsQ
VSKKITNASLPKADFSGLSKLAVAFINHKGGVGKTTTALIMTEIALSMRMKVFAADLDPQKNLSDALALLLAKNEPKRQYAENLVIADEINDEGDLIMIDCPPSLNESTARAIDFADITLIPILPDMFSVSNIGLVYKFGDLHEKSPKQLALVKVGFNKRALVEMIQLTVGSRNYSVAGEVPSNGLIPYNITTGNLWEYRTPETTRRPFYQLFENVVSAYRKMLSGDFQNAWARKAIPEI